MPTAYGQTGFAPFPLTPYLTSIAIAYRNRQLIGDLVMPRVPVGKQSFRYTKYNLADDFTVPQTAVGRKSRVNQVEFGASELSDSTVDYGLEDAIPYVDIANAADTQYDPEGRATTLLTDLIMLAREVRVAALVFGNANYGAANKSDLAAAAGVGQWNLSTADPINAILTALDTMVVRPNVAVFGRSVYTTLIQHPKVVSAAFPQGGNAAVGGKAGRQAIADLLELDEVMVGEGFLNTAKPGKPVTMARVWGKSAAFLVRSADPGVSGTMSFGVTADWQGRFAGRIDDKDIGLRGGVRVRVGESVKELLTANDLGYLFYNAIA